MKNVKRTVTTVAIVGLLLFVMSGCTEVADSLGIGTDIIVGEWQLVEKNGDAPLFVYDVLFTDDRYTGWMSGVETHTGTWTKSGDTYTLTGSFLGFADSESFTPTFSDSNNTMTYTDEDSDVNVFNRK